MGEDVRRLRSQRTAAREKPAWSQGPILQRACFRRRDKELGGAVGPRLVEPTHTIQATTPNAPHTSPGKTVVWASATGRDSTLGVRPQCGRLGQCYQVLQMPYLGRSTHGARVSTALWGTGQVGKPAPRWARVSKPVSPTQGRTLLRPLSLLAEARPRQSVGLRSTPAEVLKYAPEMINQKANPHAGSQA